MWMRRAPAQDCAGERGHEFLRQDQIARPQAGEQNFAETARIKNTIRTVEALQRRERTAGVAELAVVIVLHHVRARFARPGQKGKPPRQRERHPERRLMRWCDDREPRSRARAMPSATRNPSESTETGTSVIAARSRRRVPSGNRDLQPKPKLHKPFWTLTFPGDTRAYVASVSLRQQPTLSLCQLAAIIAAGKQVPIAIQGHHD